MKHALKDRWSTACGKRAFYPWGARKLELSETSEGAECSVCRKALGVVDRPLRIVVASDFRQYLEHLREKGWKKEESIFARDDYALRGRDRRLPVYLVGSWWTSDGGRRAQAAAKRGGFEIHSGSER